ncbi:DUF3021 domain-containing protein [Furfurilactobacillus entadae]|uniref:DUF3021 domain-containing protein n=1 Tax=Furfurilactobacillus entadae TaxID=2922307 RepID=UPI0035EF05C3
MKKMGARIGFGVIVGITVGYLIALFFSVVEQTKSFYPSSPWFTQHFTSLTTATLASTGLWIMIGVMFSLAGMVFDQERWSITKQTVVHFSVTFVLFTPLAIICGWFPLNVGWLIGYTVIYVVVYITIWLSSMMRAKQIVKRLNKSLPDVRQ